VSASCRFWNPRNKRPDDDTDITSRTATEGIDEVVCDRRTVFISDEEKKRRGLKNVIMERILTGIQIVGKSSESVQCAMLKACGACGDMGQL